MIFAAVDPGAVHAAVAVFHDATPVFVDDIRTVNGMLDATAFAHALEDMRVERLVVENVHAMRKQGVSSTYGGGVNGGRHGRTVCRFARSLGLALRQTLAQRRQTVL